MIDECFCIVIAGAAIVISIASITHSLLWDYKVRRMVTMLKATDLGAVEHDLDRP